MPLFKKRDLPNPGRLEELKKEAQAVLSPDVFEGARFEFNKSFGQKFALLHNITMVPGGGGGGEGGGEGGGGLGGGEGGGGEGGGEGGR